MYSKKPLRITEIVFYQVTVIKKTNRSLWTKKMESIKGSLFLHVFFVKFNLVFEPFYKNVISTKELKNI